MSFSKLVGWCVAGGLSLVACSSREISSSSKASPEPLSKTISPISLILSSARRGKLEPCGCTLAPLGGVHREEVALKRWRAAGLSNSLALSAGTLFASQDALPTSEVAGRARALVAALNELRTDFVSLSVADFFWGETALRDWLKAKKFDVVTTNLLRIGTKETVFSKKIEVELSGLKVWIVSASELPGAPKDSADSGTVTWVDPQKAISELFVQANKKPDLTVVLSDIQDEWVRQKLSDSIPGLSVIVGSQTSRTFGMLEPLHGESLFVDIPNEGRGLARLDLFLPKVVSQPDFYNAAVLAGMMANQSVFRERIRDLKTQLKRKGLSTDVRKNLSDLKTQNELKLKRLEVLPRFPEETSVRYEVQMVNLSRDYDPKESESSGLAKTVEKWIGEKARIPSQDQTKEMQE